MTRMLRAAIPVVVATALLTAAAATAGKNPPPPPPPSGPVTITSPKAGGAVSLKRTPTLNLAGTVAFATPAPTATKFYLRRDACGGKDSSGNAVSGPDNPHMSTTSGTDLGDGCGFIGGSGVPAEVAPGIFSTDFPSSDGMPLTLDASRNITGTLALDNSTGCTGQVRIDFVLEALHNGDGVPLGSTSVTVLVTPADTEIPVKFTIAPNAQLDKVDLSGIDLHVFAHGPFVQSGYVGLSGKSFVNVPAFTASFTRTVLLSLDDPSFTAPITATLESTATAWTASVSTPAIGSHTLYAQAAQGFTTLGTTSSAFRVTR